MITAPFPYETTIYDRNFLNCAQRQSIVMLKRDGVAVDWLFYTAQVSTDLILNFSLVEDQPKYDFSYDGLTDDDFRAIGVQRKSHRVDTFAEAKPQLLDAIRCNGFVLSSCNLFFVPHRPEYYRKKDVLHFHTLIGYEPSDRTWRAVDDTSAGLLAYFDFGEQVLQDLYNQGMSKTYRSFSTRRRDPAAVRGEIASLFRRHRESRTDSLRLLTDIETYSTTEPHRLKMLGEAFSLLSGSRLCFAQYLRLAEAPDKYIQTAETIARDATRIRDAFTIGQVSGKTNIEAIRHRALAIAGLETDLTELR